MIMKPTGNQGSISHPERFGQAELVRHSAKEFSPSTQSVVFCDDTIVKAKMSYREWNYTGCET